MVVFIEMFSALLSIKTTNVPAAERLRDRLKTAVQKQAGVTCEVTFFSFLTEGSLPF